MDHMHNMTSEHMHTEVPTTMDPDMGMGGEHAGHDTATAAMDHSAMGHGVAFDWRMNATVLWDWWQINTSGEMAASVIVIMLMGIFREFLVYSRRNLRRKYLVFLEQQAYSQKVVNDDTTGSETSDDLRVPKWFQHIQFVRFLDSALYVLQVTMSYFLMFVAMTFNPGLFIAVVLGIGLGYYLMLSAFPTSQLDGKTLQEQDSPLQKEMGEDCCN